MHQGQCAVSAGQPGATGGGLGGRAGELGDVGGGPDHQEVQ